MNDITASNTIPPAAPAAGKPRASWLVRLALLLLLLLNLATMAGGAWLWRQLDLAGREQALQQQALQQQSSLAAELKTRLESQLASEKRFREQTTDILKETS